MGILSVVVLSFKNGQGISINHSVETIETVYLHQNYHVGEISLKRTFDKNEHFNASMHEYLKT